MTIGFLSAARCWPTSSEAIDAYYSSRTPEIYFDDDTGQVLGHSFYLKVDGVWKHNHMTLGTGTLVPNSYRTVPTNVYGSCELDEFAMNLTIAEGTLIGMAIMLTWATAWGFLAVNKALDAYSGENEEKE